MRMTLSAGTRLGHYESLEPIGGDEGAVLIYVQNWVEVLKRLPPAGR